MMKGQGAKLGVILVGYCSFTITHAFVLSQHRLNQHRTSTTVPVNNVVSMHLSTFSLSDGISSWTTNAHETTTTTHGILTIPAFWSLSIMLTIVALLWLWETLVDETRTNLPSTLVPVFEKMWAEVAGLGFIGLVLEVLVHPFQQLVGELSQTYLGDEEILIESFEFLHSVFFQVGIAFFAAAGAMVWICLNEIRELRRLTEVGIDENGSCMATPEKLAQYVSVTDLPNDGTLFPTDEQALAMIPKPTVCDELQVGVKERCVQALLIREQLVRSGKISSDALIESQLETKFGSHCLELVDLSPLTWLPLLPAMALANSVDLSHDVVNAASPNAADSAGFFFSNPLAFVPNVSVVVLSLLWGLWNYWKMCEVKQMLIPTLARVDGQIRFLPPRMMIPAEMSNFAPLSPPIINQLEAYLGEPAQSPMESLYGPAGAAGPKLYLASIRYQTWLCITTVVVFGTQILTRDVDVLVRGLPAGDPSSVAPECATYALFVLLTVAQLVFLAPTTFLNYSLSSCVLDENLFGGATRDEETEDTKAVVATT